MQPWCSGWCQCVVTQPSLGVLAGDSVLWHSQASVFLLVSVCCDTAKPRCSCWCQCAVTQPSLGVLAGVSVLWHSQASVFLLVSMCCDTALTKRKEKSLIQPSRDFIFEGSETRCSLMGAEGVSWKGKIPDRRWNKQSYIQTYSRPKTIF